MFSSVLEQLQPVCVAEQKFLTSFFHFQKPEETAGVQVTQPPVSCHSLCMTPQGGEKEVDGEEEQEEEVDFLSRRPPLPVLHDIHDVGGGLQGLLAQLFQTLLPEIESLIQFGEKLDN